MPVAQDAALHALQRRADPGGIVDIIGAPVDGQFLQQVDAQLVAQRGQAARAEVMRADAVDVGLLHQLQVLPQPGFRGIQAVLRMIGEVIHPAELHRGAVQPRAFIPSVRNGGIRCGN